MEETQNISEKHEPQESSGLLQLVGFLIGEDKFAVDILMVQEIIRTTVITNLPNSPDFIEGVINLRGNIIPVIELRKRLNLPPAEDENLSNSRVLIVKVEDRVTGFMVDSVSKILKIMPRDIEQPPDIVMAGLESQYIKGVCEIEEKLVIILDFSRILQTKELSKLKEFSGEARVH